MSHLASPPESATRNHATPEFDPAGLAEELRRSVDGEVEFDPASRAAYSTDASNYRQVPIGVVCPRDPEAAAEAVAVCRHFGVPVVSRGGGTSLAGQGTNAAVVIDFSRHCNRLVSVDAENRTCVVEPGIVLDDLNRQLAPYGLRYGPEPATHPNCTLGGMIGNNSCGATAQAYGKVVDNVESLEVLLYDGTRFTCGATDDETYREIEQKGDRRAAVYRALRTLRDSNAELIRSRFPDIPRRVSGYNLDALLPEAGFDLARLIVGSEATLATVLRAELKLVPVVPTSALVVLGYPDIFAAADAVPSVLKHEPIALEGVDHRLLHDESIKQMNPDARQRLPEGKAYLLVQFGGSDQDEADERARRLTDSLEQDDNPPHTEIFDDPALEHELWLVRESGLGATAHVPDHRETYPGWEDSAVAPEKLGDYLRDLSDLFTKHGYTSDVAPSLYGHFGQGCVHTRVPFGLTDDEGIANMRAFLAEAADLVSSYGGSLSGEHGDGQARGELLERMFGTEVVRLFEEVKDLFDPHHAMNPGKVVRPAAVDEHLRLGGDWKPWNPENLYFGYPDDGGSFVAAASRCVGVGKCRQHGHSDGAVMCPSYRATREERHSTRGRSRLLFEMLDGHLDGPVTDRWQSQEVKEALDLCLACKGCKSDCPAGVDMATYKAEFLAQHYRGRIRPRADLATGWLPAAAAAITRGGLAKVVNAMSHAPGLRSWGPWLAGLEQREVPRFAAPTLQQWWRDRPPSPPGSRGRVVLWPDTFTNSFTPHAGQAAVDVLERAGWEVLMPTQPLCCGLTWVSTGQLKTARRVLRRTISQLAPALKGGAYLVGLEPSCTTVFRSDAPELLPGEEDVDVVAERTVTLAELLADHTPDWEPPKSSAKAVAQVHCHQHAVLGWDADERVLAAAGVDVERLDSGCCGLAGNFGFTAGHGEVSEACAEDVLLPRLREESPETVVLADGFSCRTQIHDLDSAGREGVHLAELLAAAYADPSVDGRSLQPPRP